MSLNLGIIASSRTASATPLLLDVYPTAAAAYSLRKLRTLYTGSVDANAWIYEWAAGKLNLTIIN